MYVHHFYFIWLFICPCFQDNDILSWNSKNQISTTEEGCKKLLRFNIILDCTKTITALDFGRMQFSIVNNILGELKLKQISFLMSIRTYHKNKDCTQSRKLGEDEMIGGLSKADLITKKIKKFVYFLSDDNFKIDCAVKLLNTLSISGKYKVMQSQPRDVTVGVVLSKRSSLEKEYIANDFASILFVNNQKQKQYFSTAYDFINSMFKDICRLINSLTSKSTSLIGQLTTPIASHSTSYSLLHTSKHIRLTPFSLTASKATTNTTPSTTFLSRHVILTASYVEVYLTSSSDVIPVPTTEVMLSTIFLSKRGSQTTSCCKVDQSKHLSSSTAYLTRHSSIGGTGGEKKGHPFNSRPNIKSLTSQGNEVAFYPNSIISLHMILLHHPLESCPTLLYFDIILDCTKNIGSNDFKIMRLTIINEILMELKQRKILFVMSGRTYHQNVDCTQTRTPTDNETFIGISKSKLVRSKIHNFTYFQSKDDFEMNCAAKLLSELQNFKRGTESKVQPRDVTVGVVLSKRSSLEKEYSGNDFASILFVNNQKQKQYFSTAYDIIKSMFKDICRLINSLTSKSTSLIGQLTTPIASHSTSLSFARTSALIRPTPTSSFTHTQPTKYSTASTILPSKYRKLSTSCHKVSSKLKPSRRKSTSPSSHCSSIGLSVSSSSATTTTTTKTTASTSTTTRTTISPWIAAEKEIDEILSKNVSSKMLKNKTFTETLVRNVSAVLRKTLNTHQEQLEKKVSRLIDYLEDVLLKLGNEMTSGQNISFANEGIDMEVSTVDTTKFTGYTYVPKNESNNNFNLPESLFDNSDRNKSVISVLYIPVPSYMKLNSSMESFQTGSKLFSVNVKPYIQPPLIRPLTYTIELEKKSSAGYRCVFWNRSLSLSGDWDDSGCKLHSINGTLVTCQCNHMTSFSVLIQTEDVRVSNKDKLALTMITYIGCGVSIVACIALIATFLMCGRLVKSDRNIIHINLAIAIGLGNTLFLLADSLHGHKYVCTGISIGMMFCYLSAFFWMLVEGIHVYQMVVKVFRVVKMMKIYLAIGWVCPAIIVAVTSSTKHEYLTREDFCWISTSSDVIWSFVGPVLCVIVTNVVILIQTLRVSYKMTVATSEALKFRKLAQLTLLLLPVFGLSWIFGILAVNDDVIIFQYVFSLLNAFQGLFIFVGYIILNSDVKREYDRVKRRSLNSSLKSHRSTDTLRSSTEEMRNRRKSSQFSLISMMSFRAKHSESMEFKLKCIESADDVFHVNTRI